MRTTLTLDDDVAVLLRSLASTSGRPFKQVVNETLRAGLAPSTAERDDADDVFPARDLGLRPGIDLVHALRLAAELDDEEAARKLELRK